LAPNVSESIVGWLAFVARETARVLVASTLEGVLAPTEREPEGEARFARASMHLQRLARTPGVRVALFSGLSLEEAASRCGELRGCYVCAEHGSVVLEPTGRVHLLDPPSDWERATTLVCLAVAFAHAMKDLIVEPKAGGVVVDHSRLSDRDRRDFLGSFRREVWDRGGQVLEHRRSVEARSRCADKGQALRWLAAREPDASAVLYAGEDETDESAYRSLASFEVSLGLHVRSPERPVPDEEAVVTIDHADRWIDLLGLVGESLATRGRKLI
jgi:trehalose 6-phosphate phosphatase